MVSMTDPATLSSEHAEEAIDLVHAREEIADDAEVEVHGDPKVPGANFVDATTVEEEPARYWVGLEREVVDTQSHEPALRRNPAYTASRQKYSAAVEAVRLAHRVPVTEALFALPDTDAAGAFFVHAEAGEGEGGQTQIVRWVDPDGTVHDGYRLCGDRSDWDEASRVARDALLDEHRADG